MMSYLRHYLTPETTVGLFPGFPNWICARMMQRPTECFPGKLGDAKGYGARELLRVLLIKIDHKYLSKTLRILTHGKRN